MKTVSEIVRLGPVIPVLAFDSVEQKTCRARCMGGLKVLEITLSARRPESAQSNGRASSQTTSSSASARSRNLSIARRRRRRARSSACRRDSRGTCTRRRRTPACRCPAMTPSDIIQALELGYEIVKFFPAQQAGGIPMLQAFYGPFPALKFLSSNT